MLSKRQVILSAIVTGVVIGMLALYIPPLFARQDAVSNFAVLKEWSAAQPSTPNSCTLHQAWEATQDFARGWSRDAGIIYLVRMCCSIPVTIPRSIAAHSIFTITEIPNARKGCIGWMCTWGDTSMIGCMTATVPARPTPFASPERTMSTTARTPSNTEISGAGTQSIRL